MKNSARHLVSYCIKAGHTVSVFDGEEWAVKRSAKINEILDAINSVDEAQLRIRDKSGDFVAWALIVNGLEPDELVVDYSDNAFMGEWDDQYNKANA